jgi:hypothetical protein
MVDDLAELISSAILLMGWIESIDRRCFFARCESRKLDGKRLKILYFDRAIVLLSSHCRRAS